MKLYKIVFPIILLVCLSACNEYIEFPGVNEPNSYQIPNMNNGVYMLEHQETIIYPNGERLYAANPDGGIGYYDLTADFAYTALSGDAGKAIYADNTAFYYFDGFSVHTTDLSGTLTGSWEIGEPKAQSLGEMLCATEDTIFLFHTEWEEPLVYESFITLIDRKSGDIFTQQMEDIKIHTINSVKAEGEYFIFQADCATDTELLTPSILRYYPADGNLEILYECPVYAAGDYVDGNLYGVIPDKEGMLHLYHVADDGTTQNQICVLDSVVRHESVSDHAGGADIHFQPTRLFFSGYDMFLWDELHHILVIHDAV